MNVIQGPDKGKKFDLAIGENIIGRSPDCAIFLSDKTVSRAHANLVARDGKWFLEDQGAANGTFINGVRINQPMVVNRGDQIRCGSTLLVFGGAPADAVPLDVDEDGNIVEAAIVASVPSSQDSVVIPTPEAGSEAIVILRIIYEFIKDVSSILDVDLCLRRTLDKVFEVIKADRGYVMLIDSDGKLHLKASRVTGKETDKRVPISRTIINEVVVKQVGVLSSNAMADKRFTAGKSVHNLSIRSAICVPIMGRDRAIGVIHVDCGVTQQTYSTEQLRVLTAIGYQTGMAIENVRLHQSAIQSERLAAVGETVAILSHHIKNILQALDASTEVVEKALGKDEFDKAKSAWPLVQRSLGRINGLILNMLMYSKHRQPSLGNVNLNSILKECVELITPQADERGVAVLTDLDELPPIPADGDGLHQAFLNLLSNALEAVQDKTGVISLASRFDTMQRMAVISFMDNGPGIPADEKDMIFAPFWSTKGQKGTGLGLAVAKKVIHEHHGIIELETKPGQGTTFTIHLPGMGKAPTETVSTV
ncbi:MAG: FHA domain-containing protein [Planctomycetes bacterium]|nr:FHA domain-containing protein [Planctomycetota bacterium]